MTVEILRKALVGMVGAAFNDMAMAQLPLETHRLSMLGMALEALGLPNDERQRSALEWHRLLTSVQV